MILEILDKPSLLSTAKSYMRSTSFLIDTNILQNDIGDPRQTKFVKHGRVTELCVLSRLPNLIRFDLEKLFIEI